MRCLLLQLNVENLHSLYSVVYWNMTDNFSTRYFPYFFYSAILLLCRLDLLFSSALGCSRVTWRLSHLTRKSTSTAASCLVQDLQFQSNSPRTKELHHDFRLESRRLDVCQFPSPVVYSQELTESSYNRYLAVAARTVRRSLKEGPRLQAERRGVMDLRFAKWEVRFSELRSDWMSEVGIDGHMRLTDPERQAGRGQVSCPGQRRRHGEERRVEVDDFHCWVVGI